MLTLTKYSDWTREDTLREIAISDIRTNPFQPRKIFNEESIYQLANSIKIYGLLNPITVRMLSNGKFELIAGERRLRACKFLGMKTVKAIIKTSVDQDSAMLAMIENLQRENLHFFEEAEGYLALIKEHGMTQETLARRISKNQSTIANKLRLLKLPKAVKSTILSAGLTERHARALLRLHNEKSQIKLLDIIVKNNYSVRETEILVEKEIRRIYDGDGKRKIAYIFRDFSLYINTVKKAIKEIKNAGLCTDMKIDEKDDEVKLYITLKKPVNANNNSI